MGRNKKTPIGNNCFIKGKKVKSRYKTEAIEVKNVNIKKLTIFLLKVIFFKLKAK